MNCVIYLGRCMLQRQGSEYVDEALGLLEFILDCIALCSRYSLYEDCCRTLHAKACALAPLEELLL